MGSFNSLLGGSGGNMIAQQLGATPAQYSNPFEKLMQAQIMSAPAMIRAEADAKYRAEQTRAANSERVIKESKFAAANELATSFASQGRTDIAKLLQSGLATGSNVLEVSQQLANEKSMQGVSDLMFGGGGQGQQTVTPNSSSSSSSSSVPMDIPVELDATVPAPYESGYQPDPDTSIITGQVKNDPPSRRSANDKALFNTLIPAFRSGKPADLLEAFDKFRDGRIKQSLMTDMDNGTLEPVVQVLQAMLTTGSPSNTALQASGLGSDAHVYAAVSEAIKVAKDGGASQDSIDALYAMQLSNLTPEGLQKVVDRVHKWGMERETLDAKKDVWASQAEANRGRATASGATAALSGEKAQTEEAKQAKLRAEAANVGKPKPPTSAQTIARQNAEIKKSEKLVRDYEKQKLVLEQKQAKAADDVTGMSDNQRKVIEQQIADTDAKLKAQEAELQRLGGTVPGGGAKAQTKQPLGNLPRAKSDRLQKLEALTQSLKGLSTQYKTLKGTKK